MTTILGKILNDFCQFYEFSLAKNLSCRVVEVVYNDCLGMFIEALFKEVKIDVPLISRYDQKQN